MENITIGIEGLVGAGKTSLSRELLNMIPNSIILHGGNLYRGVVVALMNSKMDFNQMKKKSENIDIKQLMDRLHVEIKIENRESVVYVADKKIDEEILQSDRTSMAVSNIALSANNNNLYLFARNLIDNLKKEHNIIISGRDLMKIYPGLDYHFFITATLDARVSRKASQYIYNEIDLNKLKEHIQKRDELQEKAGYYTQYNNTIEVDVTNCKSAKESAKKVYSYISNS